MIDTVSTDIPEGAERRLRLDVEDGIGVLTLCRPARLNAWSWESTRQLGLYADRIRFDASIRAVLLRAEGRAFCAGIDISAPGGAITGRSAAERTANYYEGIRWAHERFRAFAGLPQPVVAAVQGYCLGFGFELALMADVRIAADDAVFALPEAQLGVTVDAGGDLRIAREAGAGWAKYLALTGRRIDAPTAARLHLAQLVVPRTDLDPTAREVAAEIAANAPLAVRGVKRDIDAYADAGLGRALDRVALAASVTLTSEDVGEGFAAKTDGREAEFGGK
ncbi:enoyl-CoA hydratase/isomerase family protein [Streptomyces flavofungini]|uniref:Enoyl-CoA hydratase/isomerase family protein n=1 Tax=Streptomyces flavofungini TaxID=68200 RepID=A0ABS0X9F7_9ACTN|nr:enoyl-CoA hydratase/isomerase family protein [Streptomyces flavofungini]MBJ3809784.1 enoyl-CoA hydratase/isomerase family protein [Streptomyces flavofungini]GHC80729.1 enoyl-CoA hydratase [Streptomyces flavofungini]